MSGTTSSAFDVVLADDFSQGYKTENWGYAFDGGTYWNGAFEWSNDDVAVRDGTMQVTVTRHADGHWTTGGFNSFKAGKDILYGRIEFDGKVEESQGTMGVFLTWATQDNNWPAQGEIDILETPGQDVMHTTHWQGGDGSHQYDSVRNLTEAAPVDPPPGSGSQVAGTGPDALVLKVSQDAYQGNAQYTVKVDGQQVGGTFTASASHAAGQSDTLTLKGDFKGDWGPGAHQVSVEFLNDHWHGTAATDRNLYVDGATYNGQAVAGSARALMSAGVEGFAFTDAAEPAPAPVAEVGTDGADLFDATAATSVFTGKGGRDLFVFEAGDGDATVTDFASGTDKLVFVGLDREDVTTAAATSGPPGLVVHYGDGGSVFLAGVSALAGRDMVFA